MPEDVGTVDYRGRKLTPRQIADLARRAGFRGNDLTIAVAVALAESAGRTNAVGDRHLQTGTWGPSIGPWQIRSLNAERGKGGVRDEKANMDPLTNARHARAIQRSARGWKHWSTVLHGSYLKFMPAARAVT